MFDEDVLSGINRVLLVQLSAIGDILRAGSVVQSIRNNYPGIRVGMIVYEDYEDVIEGIPGLHYRHVFPNLKLKHGISKTGIENIARSLYDNVYGPVDSLLARHYDLAVNFHFSKVSGMLAAFSGATKIIGLASTPAGGMDISSGYAAELYETLADSAKREKHMEHMAVRYHRLCGLPVDDVRMDFEIQPCNKPEQTLNSNQFCLHVGAGWTEKSWPAVYLYDLAKRISKIYGWTPVLIGTDFERDRYFPAGFDFPVIDMCGKPFMESAKSISESRFFVGADSGPMHLASALNVPVIGLFGKTSVAESYPLHGTNGVIRKTGVPDISVEDVLHVIEQISCLKPGAIGDWASVTSSFKDASEINGTVIYNNPYIVKSNQRRVA